MIRTNRRVRRVARKGGALAVVFALPLLLAGPARAGQSSSAPSLGGWNISADGNAVDILADNTTGLAGIHPLTEADFPEAQSQFATGPFGSGLATVFWPGSAGGNFGSLSAELGFPSQLQPIASQLNDPIKASAQYPAGPASARYPAGSSGGVAVMQATAQPGGTTAEAAIVDQAASSVLSFASAKGTSSATAAATAKADSAAALKDVKLLGGIIDIGSISSTAEAVSDGNTGTGSAVTHVAGVTVMGQPASLGSDGLVLPSFAQGPLGGLTGPVIQNAVSQVISGLGLTITELPSSQVANGSGFTASSGGVSIEIDPPSSAAPLLEQAASNLAPFFPAQAAIIPTLPGLLQGFTLTITLGRATAAANASAPFSLNFVPPPASVPPLAASPPSTFSSPPAASGPVASAVTPTATAASPSVAPTPPASAGSTTGPAPVTAPRASLISLSKPLAAGAVVLGLLVALAFAFGLWRLGRMLLPSDAAAVCPYGQDQP